VKPHFATDAAELGIMEDIVEFQGILYAENVAEQDILLMCIYLLIWEVSYCYMDE
jgi:hypothetical protein